MFVIHIMECVDGGASPFDGQYVQTYDPERDGVAPDGSHMGYILETTPRAMNALGFATAEAAAKYWSRICERAPVRPWDGKPNRPLTVFTVAIEPW